MNAVSAKSMNYGINQCMKKEMASRVVASGNIKEDIECREICNLEFLIATKMLGSVNDALMKIGCLYEQIDRDLCNADIGCIEVIENLCAKVDQSNEEVEACKKRNVDKETQQIREKCKREEELQLVELREKKWKKKESDYVEDIESLIDIIREDCNCEIEQKGECNEN